MRKKRMISILVIEAAVCVIFCFLQINFSGIFSAMVAFPFEQIGFGLRRLSLSGSLGNIAAILLYILLSGIPCLIWYALKRTRKMLKADYLLFALSALLFIINYYMINPGLIASTIPGTGKWMLGSVFYSVLAGYLVIRNLKVYSTASLEKLQDGLVMLLGFLNMIFVYIIFGQYLSDLLQAVGSVQTGNDAMLGEIYGNVEFGVTYFFLGLHYLVNILPYVLDMGIVILGTYALLALKHNRYSDESVRSVNQLAGFCVNALWITAGADVAFNLLQLLFHNRLYQIDIVIHIPVLSMVFVFAVLLVAKYVQENQKLKQDNDLFI